MIGNPYNDHECLGYVMNVVEQMVLERDPTLVELAHQLGTLENVVAFIRALPQRNDESDLLDGPKIGRCAPPQRLRIPAPDPNCFERAALYLALAELIDPRPLRQLATSTLPQGPHTVPMEDGVVVNLNPETPNNAIEGGLADGLRNAAPMTLSESVEWSAAIAEEPATAWPGGERRVRNARETLRSMQAGEALTGDAMADVAFTLALAAREATRWGAAGREIVRSTMRALCLLQAQILDDVPRDPLLPDTSYLPASAVAVHRNLDELRIDDLRNGSAIADGLGALVRSAGRIGTTAVGQYGDVALAAAGMYLAGLGVTPVMVAIVEQELRQEGLTLGALAKPAPKKGTVAAVTPVGRAARAIAAQEPAPSL
jgi:hypothetical protein